MRRAIIHDPEDMPGLIIRRLTHYLFDKSIKGGDPTFLLATAKHLGPVDIERRQIRPCTTALILMFYLHHRAGLGTPRGIDSCTGLNTGFLIGRDNEFILFERFIFPYSFVQIQNASGFCTKLRIARKYPATMLPGSNRILI